MATRRKKTAPTELTGTEDPGAPLDGAALLAAAKPLLKALAADLLARADESPAVTEALQARHAQEQKAERTADAYPEWRRALVEQVAASWLLSCVFVRTLEDRDLLGRRRIAGPGAQDSWKAFLQLAPSLSEREYLLSIFRELARLPAAADLFDARHNPVWLLAPSAEGARNLLNLFRSPSADAPTFRFGGEDTRFLGDLYQDLSEDVRKRFALLQTPRFVESFILDRTLEPAIERFGLDDTNLIDPTCGSGHFLLGAFERLFDHRLRAEPGLSPREAATKALNAVAGSDINPYAIAIARFRLTLAFIEKCGITRLKDVPRLPLHLAVADSLLYNPQIGQLALVEGTDPSKWEGAHFSLEDPKAARDVLFKQYAAVVGNPPYITVKDSILRERYRDMYASAFRTYSLAVPFTERFFQLGRSGAQIGMITANSFMKREFGKVLIEKFLPTVNLELIVNTSGAYIPSHGTPTVLLFGINESSKGSDLVAVLANRGEPATPEVASEGLVWSSIATNWNNVGFENDYISVSRLTRATLLHHPWSLGGAGAGELKELLEERATGRLVDVIETPIGRAARVGCDDAYMVPPHVAARTGALTCWRDLLVGEALRDWSVGALDKMLFPYDEEADLAPRQEDDPEMSTVLKYLWPFRTTLAKRATFQGQMSDAGLRWYEYMQYTASANRTPLSITFPFVATHNHFVLDHGGKVFKQTAPVIKLPETATEDDHLALLAYLNSSTAGFYLRQVLHSKGAQGVNEGHKSEEWEQFLEYSGAQVATLPLPNGWRSLAPLGRLMLRLVDEYRAAMPQAVVAEWTKQRSPLYTDYGTAPRDLLRRLITIQEEIDWAVYELFGLAESPSLSAERAATIAVFGNLGSLDHRAASPFPLELTPGHRPFELLMRGQSTQWFRRNGYAEEGEPESYGQGAATLLNARIQVIRENRNIEIVEQPQYKRRWTLPDVEREASAAVREWSMATLEKCFGSAVAATGAGMAVTWMRSDSDRTQQALEAYLDGDAVTWCRNALSADSVPFLAALRHTETGLEKRSLWEQTWASQRAEDTGEPDSVPVVPPKYDQKDYRASRYFHLRGKLDVPKERFISYPGCERDEDKEPVYGWAGWDHLQRAVALAGLYQDRKQREGWTKDRLKPMLAGLLELLPWLKQWHHEPSAELGGERPSDQFEAFLNAECSEFGFTHDDLRAWRPTAKVRGGGKAKKSKSDADVAEGEDG